VVNSFSFTTVTHTVPNSIKRYSVYYSRYTDVERKSNRCRFVCTKVYKY